MGDKNKSAKDKEKLDQQANAWFDRVDDRLPFDAFGNSENKRRIGDDIFTRIQADIQHKKSRAYFFMKIAASLLIAAISITTYRLISDQHAKNEQLVWQVYRSGAGEFKTVTLPDSSVIYLRPGTSLYAPTAFTQSTRTVKLTEGEAYFTVKHDTRHPFVVDAAGISTQVLGTSFVIRNYRAASTIQVSLITGKVAVKHEASLLGMLTPLQEITYNKKNHNSTLDKISADWINNWKSGDYLLNDVPIEELAATLKNLYGVNVVMRSGNLEKLRITTQFNKKDNIRDILEQLKLIHGLNYEIKDKEVILMR
ncbi:FecR family protein [Mucilaginibacter paludis]|uniref:Anti-FecI sigma factor, FecR n=1 Tax=Mucilaginibacter paludis DSM 18603 TaxID=714943 RepID=H1YHU5_9SPHI|nr:FecR domain-containing protein [Mucilaginibacter paludis]EHQ27495.1 anti-FecI sigma factor, FecR [Mucilaginibacter paludis DSM 18603]